MQAEAPSGTTSLLVFEFNTLALPILLLVYPDLPLFLKKCLHLQFSPTIPISVSILDMFLLTN